MIPGAKCQKVMNIGIDIRPLLGRERSGVGEYTYQFLNAIFNIDKNNQYFLFYNAFKQVNGFLPKSWKEMPNVHFCGFRWPNKILNFCFKFLRWPKADKMIKQKIDLFFIPNLNFIALSQNVKKIVTVHDLSFLLYPRFFSWKRRLWHWFVNPRKLIYSCDKIIAVSENTKRDLVELYKVVPEKVEVVYSGVRYGPEIMGEKPKDEEVKRKYNLPEYFILFLGTFEPRKNIEGLIRAFEILKAGSISHIPNLGLVIAGAKGWGYKDIFKKVKYSQFRDDIKLINYILPEEKFIFYKLARLFVYPSFYEGFGFPPLEAAAAGTPVIISAVSSLPEVMGEAALMVNPYNPAEIAKVMAECLTNQELRQRLIEKGKRQVEKFNWQDCAKKTFDLIFKL